MSHISAFVAAREHAANDNAPLPGRAEDNSTNRNTYLDTTRMTLKTEGQQGRRLLDELGTGPKTTFELLAAGIKNPSALISKLRDARHSISTKLVNAVDKNGIVHSKVAEYRVHIAFGSIRPRKGRVTPVQSKAESTSGGFDHTKATLFSQIWGDERPASARDGTMVVDRHHKESMASLSLWVGDEARRVIGGFNDRFLVIVTGPRGRTTIGVGDMSSAAVYWTGMARDDSSWLLTATLLTDSATRHAFDEILRATPMSSVQGAA